ncbi:MAG: tail fiber domain-containing protein, partial [Candidatus Omnitrophica bacterium]|nr:tail fiber domain-containing protein [Candidatus Omnitrophota bacterium]
TALGSNALLYNTTGSQNTALGTDALIYNVTGSQNTALGYQVLFSNTTGYSNTALGTYALYYNTTGYYNTALGVRALYYNTTGYFNTALGYHALYLNTTGNSNTALGYGADVTRGDLYNATAIGYNAKVEASNKIRLGDKDVKIVESSGKWSTVSDERTKKEIKDCDLGLDFIRKLHPISFKKKNQDDDGLSYGFTAQDVEKALGNRKTNVVGIDAYGMKTLAYDDLIAPLVKSIQQQQEEIEELRKEIESLKTRKEGV